MNRFALLSAATLASLLAACNIGAPDNEAVVDEAVLNSTLLPELPRNVAPLDRAGLIAAIDAAAGAFALGADDREAQAQLVNRKFVIRQPFGCGGLPVGSGALTIGRADGAMMKLAATPDIGATALGEGSRVEAAEGFWIARPWVRDERCPTVRPEPGAGTVPTTARPMPLTTLTEKTAGLVQFFDNGDGQMVRREGEGFTATAPLPAGAALPAEGVALTIEGRLRPFPTGQVIRCRVAAEGMRPVCFASIQADRVAFERLDSGAPLAEWKNR